MILIEISPCHLPFIETAFINNYFSFSLCFRVHYSAWTMKIDFFAWNLTKKRYTSKFPSYPIK